MGKIINAVLGLKEKAKDAIRALHKAFSLDSDVVAEVKGDLPNF